MKKVSFLLVTLFLLASCSQEQLELSPQNNDKKVTSRLSFTVAPMCINDTKATVQTKSTDPTTVDESQISDMWVIQFDKATGAFISRNYSINVDISKYDAPLAPSLSGPSDIYFLANIGPNLPITYTRTDFLAQTKTFKNEASAFINGKPISGNTKLNIPMFGSLLNNTVPSTGSIENINIPMIRMLARVDITYTVPDELANSFALEGIRLRNIPISLQFSPAGTATSSVTSTITVQDYPITALAATTGTNTLTFYLPENQKGEGQNTALTNERLKIGVPNATYIEFTGHTKGKQGGQDVGLCIYPGKNVYNDYNITRNTKYASTVTFSDVSPTDQRVKIHDSNCFMLRPGGSCNISVLRANKSNLGIQIPDVTTGWTVSVYWQTTADMITVDNSTTKSLGYFKVNAAAGKEGSAIVVVKVGSDVVWSWHIWVLNDDLSLPTFQQVYSNFTWMDRNLGATRTTTYNVPYVYSAIGGMMYQWGRKDPIIGSVNVGTNPAPFTLYGASGTGQFTPPSYSDVGTINGVTNDNYTKTATTIAWADKFKYSVRYPALFIYDWYGSTAIDTRTTAGIDSWGGEFNQPKALYDPCPEGWRVPSAKRTSTSATNPWSIFTIASWPSSSASDGNVGAIYVSGVAWQVYPMMGLRGSSGAFQNANYAYLNAATVTANNTIHGMYLTNSTFTNNLTGLAKYYATGIRCVKEW